MHPFPIKYKLVRFSDVSEQTGHAVKRSVLIMNIGLILLMITGGSVGIFSTLFILISLPVTIIQKIYRKTRYGIPLTK